MEGDGVSDAHRDYFNRHAPEWNRLAPQEPRLKEYLIRFGLIEGDRVLDVGAGTGRTTAVIRECIGPSGRVVAQDLAEYMLFEAKASLSDSGALFLCSDVIRLAVRNDSFDKILCFSAFPHFRDRIRSLSEMHRVLKVNGRLLILHSSPHQKLNAFHASLEGVVRGDVLPAPEDMRRMMEKSGFHVVLASEAEDYYWVEGEKTG
jgi:ubiquinone/menaquinone biosynthesis C-methylase UbiE